MATKPGKSDKYMNEVGLNLSHAYTVLGTKTLTDKDNKKIRLVKIRNPWGEETYNGAFSDKSDLWTDDLRKQAGAVKKNDGVFFMPIADYKKWCNLTTENINVDKMSRSSFLVLDDTAEPRDGGKCNGTCSYHKFTVKSKETQTVYLKVATWERRGVPKKCFKQVDARNGGKQRKHAFALDGGIFDDGYYYEWAGGDAANWP